MQAEVLGSVVSKGTVTPAEVFRVGPFDDPDRYEIGEPVEAGAEGILYRGQLVTPTSRLSLPVAVKALQPVYSARIDQWAARWRDQVELLRSLHIPGLVGVREGFVGPLPHLKGAETAGRNLYLVMNWVEGEALDHWVLSHRDMDVGKALKLLLPVAVAIDTMHGGQLTGSVPVVHRDIKPANILIGKEGSVLVDFGLTRGLSSGHPVGRAGTPGYIAPEVVAGGAYTAAADRYAFGATVFFLLTGRHPATGIKAGQLRHLLEASPAGGAEGSSEMVDRVVAMLDPDPDRRPIALANWIAQLRQSSLGDEILPTELPPLAPTRAPRARLGSIGGRSGSLALGTLSGSAGSNGAGLHPRPGVHRAHPPPMHARRRRATRNYALAMVLVIALVAVASDAAIAHSHRRGSGGVTVAVENPGHKPTGPVGGAPVDVRATNTVPEIGTSALIPPPGLPTTTTPTTKPQSCLRSFSPACGPLTWVPAPVNHPLSVGVSWLPLNPMVGDVVTFTVTLDDPDDNNLQVQQSDYGVQAGGVGTQVGAVGAGPVGPGCQQPYGTWPLPPAHPHGHAVATQTYVYMNPGAYQVHFVATSGPSSGCTPDPWASTASSIIETINVAPSPPPSTTTTTTTTTTLPPPPSTTTSTSTTLSTTVTT